MTAPMGNERADADQQVADMVVIPYPAALEVRELNLALPDLAQKVVERRFGTVKGSHSRPMPLFSIK